MVFFYEKYTIFYSGKNFFLKPLDFCCLKCYHFCKEINL